MSSEETSGETPIDPRHEDLHHLRQRLHDAAFEAERGTGRADQTDEETRRSLTHRLMRGVVGVVVIVLGILALPLPGPGALIIIVGLTLLPFAWADRMVIEIRRRTPGVPESGRVPARSWVVMGAMVTATTAASMLWADDLSAWINGL